MEEKDQNDQKEGGEDVKTTSLPSISSPTFSVSGKQYIVTGSTQGLGKEICKLLVQNGAKKIVVLNYYIVRFERWLII